MRVLVATTQVPFVRGGAEQLTEDLRRALEEAGHEAEIVAIPFKWYPAERVLTEMAAARLLSLTEFCGSVDRVIGLRFPAYLMPHPAKVLWLMHQHRSAYDLWDHPMAGDLRPYGNGTAVRDVIRQADRCFIPEAHRIFTISRTVSRRLCHYSGIHSRPLHPPLPHADRFYAAPAHDYIFFPSRLSELKRQTLVIEALSRTRMPVRLRFAGASDSPEYRERLGALAVERGVADRLEWLGMISTDEKYRQYAHALAVIFPPLEEDYGYVTLEAMASSKPVITCRDSGEPLEFVEHRRTGLVCEPVAEALAEAMDELWCSRDLAQRLGRAGRELWERVGSTWPAVLEQLLR